MLRLRTGYVISGFLSGMVLLFSFLWSLPDGKLHIVFCNVGQGDAAYIRFPDGRDGLIDGGPNDSVLQCLGRHMPFWDRTIDLVVLTHPERDHLGGIPSVFERFTVGYFIRSDVASDTEGFQKIEDLVRQKKIFQKLVTKGEHIDVGTTSISVVWPTKEELAFFSPSIPTLLTNGSSSDILGSSTPTNLNDASVVIHLRYGTFDALFPGDADSHVDGDIVSQPPVTPDTLELLKVPHHGSKTGMTEGFLDWISQNNLTNNQQPITNSQSHPLAVISVGKNSYGHPAKETVEALASRGLSVMRTDESGDIEVVTDGTSWSVKDQKKTILNKTQ
jgi:competence protein ComEC